MTLAALISTYGNDTATKLGMSAGDKLALIDALCRVLRIGGWVCGDDTVNFDVTDDDVTVAWSEVETKSGDPCISAYNVALLVATTWERECVTCG